MEEEKVVPLRYCIYARKSMEAEERQALSIESQIKEMRAIARRDHLTVVSVKKEAHSAKTSGTRAVFNEMVHEIKAGKYNAILTWNADRLSRNAGDLGILVDLMDQDKLVRIRTFNQDFSNSPNEKFLLMILGSQAKLENDNKAVNVKRGLRASVAKGLWPTGTPIGYRSLKRTDKPGELEVDRERAPVIKEIFEKVAYEGWSQRRVQEYLEDIGFRSVNGKVLSFSSVQNMLHRTFYYGRFEYPVGSGKWYTGKHEPIITKELFDFAQEAVRKRNTRRFGKSYAYAPFTFLRLMRCGKCGAGITAREIQKYRRLTKDFSHFRYYVCGRTGSRGCGEKYINERDLMRQLVDILDQVDLDYIGMREEFEESVHRFYKIQSAVTGEPLEERSHEKRDLDLRAWAKIVFTDGTPDEQRAILARLKSRLILKDKHIYLDKSALPTDEDPPEPRILALDIRTTDRGLIHRLMDANTVSPGQHLLLPGGARLVYEGSTPGKGTAADLAFRVERLDPHAARMFASWLYRTLAPRRTAIERLLIDDRNMPLESIKEALGTEEPTPAWEAKRLKKQQEPSSRSR